MRKITHLVLHCTATPQTATVENIQRYWRQELKWKAPGYHHLIQPGGQAIRLAPDEVVTNGVAGHNRNSIHISYIGGVDQWNKPTDNRTAEQLLTMTNLVKYYKGLYPNAIVLGHRDFPGVAKACPSFDVKNWLKNFPL